MKSFNDAMNIVKINVSNYQKLCQNAKNQVLSDKEAFFKNLFCYHVGGQTGHQRASKFITNMEQEVKKNNITKTEQLIDFMVSYFDKGSKLSNFIWKSVREAAGFCDAHINFLIPTYQAANERYTHNAYEEPSKEESRVALEKLFNLAITGSYSAELLKYLNSYLCLETNRCADYGKKLLDHLNGKMVNVKQEAKPNFTIQGKK